MKSISFSLTSTWSLSFVLHRLCKNRKPVSGEINSRACSPNKKNAFNLGLDDFYSI